MTPRAHLSAHCIFPEAFLPSSCCLPHTQMCIVVRIDLYHLFVYVYLYHLYVPVRIYSCTSSISYLSPSLYLYLCLYLYLYIYV